MKTLVMFIMVIIIFYLIFGALMYFMMPGKDWSVIILGPAKMLWNLFFGYMGMVEY